MGAIRLKRVESELKKIFSNTVQYKLNDEKLSFVNITRVKVSKDLSYAKVYFSYLDDSIKKDVVRARLARASGLFKKEIASAKFLRKIPKLKFFYDDTGDEVDRLDEIFRKLNESANYTN